MDSKSRGTTFVELLVLALFIFACVFFLVYHGDKIREYASRRRCIAHLRAIGTGLQVYAAEQPSFSFPQEARARDAFRKIFVEGNIEDVRVFDCPSRPGAAYGRPGPFLNTPSQDLDGVEYAYTQVAATLNSSPQTVLAADLPGSHPGHVFHVLHADGTVTEESSMPDGLNA